MLHTHKTQYIILGVFGMIGLVVILCLSIHPRDRKSENVNVSRSDNQTSSTMGTAKEPLHDMLPSANTDTLLTCVHSEGEESRSQDPDIVARIEDQMSLASSVFGLDFTAGVRTDEEETDSVFGRVTRAITFQNGTRVAFDLATGQVVSFYTLERMYETVPEGLTKNDAISKEKAATLAQKLIRDLGIQIDFKFSRISYHGPSKIGSDSLAGSEWRCTGALKYQGIPYFPSGLRVCMSAYSGKVHAYTYNPIGPLPVNLEERITADEAMTIAGDFLGIGLFDMLGGVRMPPPNKVIACRNNYYSYHGDLPLAFGNSAYLCWDVVVDNGRDLPRRVFVNASTGEVIGGI